MASPSLPVRKGSDGPVSGVPGRILALPLASARASAKQTPVGAGSQKLVLFVLWAHGTSPITIAQLSDLAGISATQAHRALSILRRAGMVREVCRTAGPGYPTRGYEVVV